MPLIEMIKKEAKTAKWVGILLLIAGFLALVAPFAAGLSITFIIGVLLLISGAAQLLLVFRAGSFGEGLWLVLLGLLSLIAGGYMLFQPLSALASLTLFLAAYFIVSGVIETVGAFGAKPAQGWGWLLFGGIVSILLGVMIWRQFPVSGAWAIGTLVGVRMMMSGWSLIAIGGLAKGTNSPATETPGA
jgi:uncharacterized membrane protein HdeD (DUF308 family)